MTNTYDWRNKVSDGWPYSSDAPENKKWQKDRSETFKENGNGWWWGQGKNEKQGEEDGEVQSDTSDA